MSLRDEIAHRLCERLDDHWFLNKGLYRSEADAILALVRAHMTSDEAVERAHSAYVAEVREFSPTKQLHRAAILAALGEGE